MASEHLQMSEWTTTTGAYLSHRQDLSKENGNRIISNETCVVDVNQRHTSDQNNRR